MRTATDRRLCWRRLLPLLPLSGIVSGAVIGSDTAPAEASASTGAAGALFSITAPDPRAAWQQKLTLGPGDVLTFSLYGEEQDLTRRDVPIGPDGRVSYLEAQNLMAAGLTVDEFRIRLNEELGKFRRAPRAYVAPVAYNSLKYYIFGKVGRPGAFLLDRPVTLVEAVVRAGGMQTEVAAGRRIVLRADLSQSFVVRDGRKLPVDFGKLFLSGDLSHNIVLEPDDYIYLPGVEQARERSGAHLGRVD